jgi:hypothetical protein
MISAKIQSVEDERSLDIEITGGVATLVINKADDFMCITVDLEELRKVINAANTGENRVNPV